jgi:hypothetical protein
VARYDGTYDHVFESSIAGIAIQAPQLDINTVSFVTLCVSVCLCLFVCLCVPVSVSVSVSLCLCVFI